MWHRKAPPSIDISILARGASFLYALFDYGFTNKIRRPIIAALLKTIASILHHLHIFHLYCYFDTLIHLVNIFFRISL
ncbi:hypothetical protein [Ornithinibacillus sp. FSL M8-0202]|uniref:hypothetical protein n=1 Tax=Ornithinibacillus sp. FSL M8-0202 TaxID=2921616 RepID=UPI0030CC9564